jgi:hypothetical protein
MKNPILIMMLAVGIFVVCQKSANSPSEPQGTGDLVQLGGCARGTLEKISDTDSCFTYIFGDILTVDFCVTANCCPDTDRFQLDYSIKGTTIQVTVADTAENLCRCICPYLIHTEFSDLSKDSYHFLVDYNDSLIYDRQIFH